MFEKSLYDLIRGLRRHKGNEREYIQGSIRECRKEIKGQDMDLKATAVLKLTYLEMFGHDMSWASFNILEVMSSPNYNQKKVGYLGAVQSFRPDTEVLMLAENLLKKDLMSPQIPTMSLPLIAIPHVISPSMANSLLSDLLPRLTHSSQLIRKKAIVTLYRLALVYPETLRPAWPKIKERLLDENEDPSVTAAVVNVVCELGWRRPQDFLPLAPRLFDLLVAGSNNWMAIKIIKLFATLTPLEPRLVNKILNPLTNIIKTTPAMSLLYECINGIIQGGILESAQGTTKGDEIARLCVSKLRSMLVIEGDPNLKYVSLLAFNRIVEMHPYLVTTHEDVVMECIDDGDISIRTKALDLVVGMVNPNNLVSIVDRLMLQIESSFGRDAVYTSTNEASGYGVTPTAIEDDDEAQQSIAHNEQISRQPPPLPDDYKTNVISRILEMCSRNTYANINDFDWYIDILVRLVKCVPGSSAIKHGVSGLADNDNSSTQASAAYGIGCELRNVAVRVRSSRAEATRAAELLITVDRREQLFPPSGNGGLEVLEPAVWIVGEYAHLTNSSENVLSSLLHSSTTQLPSPAISAYLQAIIKVFAHLTGDEQQAWTAERKTMVSLLTAKVVNFFEPLTTHPDLEVQERAVEYLELSRLATEAISGHATGTDMYEHVTPPLLLTQAIPALFSGIELNPVAKDAQKKVPLLENLDLDKPINENLNDLLYVPDHDLDDTTTDEFYAYYNERPLPKSLAPEPAAKRLEVSIDAEMSYQQSSADYLSDELTTRRKAERRDRNRDDPFYIPSEGNSGRGTPTYGHQPKSNSVDEFDVNSIPIMELELTEDDTNLRPNLPKSRSDPDPKKRVKRNFEILGDETIGEESNNINSSSSADVSRNASFARPATGSAKSSLLQVDSTGLGTLSLDGKRGKRTAQFDVERKEAEDVEMAKAMQEVERLRLEMQRNAEKIEFGNGMEEETVVKRKKKKKLRKATDPETNEVEQSEKVRDNGNDEGSLVTTEKKKKKKKKDKDKQGEVLPGADNEAEAAAKPKKKKKRREINFEDDENTTAEPS